MRRIWTLLVLVFVAWSLAAEEPAAPIEWSFTGELTLRPDRLDDQFGVYDRLNTAFHYRYSFLHLVADLSLVNDERYEPFEPWMLGRNFLLNNGGFELDFDSFVLRAGRFVHQDFLDVPYPLFISSEPLPALLADITFRGGPFTYESRWIQLNTRSVHDYPDRGANYKVFALKVGDWRFGLQDSTVYYGRTFDAEYFLSPIPHIFTQMVTRMDATPWREDTNDNSITGLFAERRRAADHLYAQWLVDDISLDFLIPWFLRDELGHNRVIANKMAWTVGGHWTLPFGRLGLHHAGATKFTFGPTRVEEPYGYTYYPTNTYYPSTSLEGAESTKALDYRDNYLGYKYGENNLAFLLEFQRPLLGAAFGASLEYVLSGSKSPAVPWHDLVNPRRTQLLDDPVLEHTVAAEVSAAWPLRNWTVFTRLRLGGVFNRLAWEPAVAPYEEVGLFRPQPGEHALLYGVTLGVSYGWKIGGGGSAPGAGAASEAASAPAR